MQSSHAQIHSELKSELKPELKQTHSFRVQLNDKTLKTLSEFRETLENYDEKAYWPHLEEKNPFAECQITDLMAQFDLIDDILEIEYAKQKTSKNKDELKIALEYYKLAIMEATLNEVCEEKPENEGKKPSRFIHGIYYFLFVGGSWIAYLHGYDAAQAIINLLPVVVPSPVIWTTGSALFLIALALFTAFEAEELSKHMGFQFAKNLKTTFNINQYQIEVTHEIAKHLAIHSEKEKIMNASDYKNYVKLLMKFDRSISKTKERVSHLEEGRKGKAAKTALLIFGMLFTAADEVFLTIGFGALALTGPWGWVILGITALIGAILFYVAFHNMVRDKVAPMVKQKEEILETYAIYKKDNILEGIKKKLETKKYIARLEKKLIKQNDIIREQNEEIAELKKSPSPLGFLSRLTSKLHPNNLYEKPTLRVAI